MIMKQFAYISVTIFIISSLIMPIIDADSFDMSKTNIIKTTKTSEEITEYWALLVGSNPYDDLTSPEWAESIKKILCMCEWKEDHIKLLTGHISQEEFFNACNW